MPVRPNRLTSRRAPAPMELMRLPNPSSRLTRARRMKSARRSRCATRTDAWGPSTPARCLRTRCARWNAAGAPSIARSTIAPASPRPPARSSALWSPVLPTSADQHYPCISREPRKLGARPISSCIRLSPVYESRPLEGRFAREINFKVGTKASCILHRKVAKSVSLGGADLVFSPAHAAANPPDIDRSPPTVV